MSIDVSSAKNLTPAQREKVKSFVAASSSSQPSSNNFDSVKFGSKTVAEHKQDIARSQQEQEVTIAAGPPTTRQEQTPEGTIEVTEQPVVDLPVSEVSRRSAEAFQQVVRAQQAAGGGTVTTEAIEAQRTANIAREVAEKGGVSVRTDSREASDIGIHFSRRIR